MYIQSIMIINCIFTDISNLLHPTYPELVSNRQRLGSNAELETATAQDVALWTSFGPSKGVSGAIESRAEKSEGVFKDGEEPMEIPDSNLIYPVRGSQGAMIHENYGLFLLSVVAKELLGVPEACDSGLDSG